MSKTIEFVEEIIKNTKRSIEENKRLKAYYLAQETDKHGAIMSVEQNIKYLRNKLSVWEQIKAELEAWEVVKPYIEEGVSFTLSKFLKNDTSKFKTLKKALEIENDK